MGTNREPTIEQTVARQKIYGGKTRAMYMQDIFNLTMLKTPSSAETEGGVMEIRPGCDGHWDQIAMLPTPNFTGGRTAPDTHKTERRERGVKCGGEDLSTRIGASRGLKLQPAFVEHLMGYPIGFTEIEEN
jgi:hypothetical protein